jgi:hypothetical protein
VAWLFGRGALFAYALILAIGVAALLSDPRCLPRVGLLLADQSGGAMLLSVALLAAVAAKHELAHVAAGRYLGVDARVRLGYRLIFPVLETNLTDLWMVPRRRRYVAYLAGAVSDLLAASVALAILWSHHHGWIALTPGLYRALELIVFIAGCVVVWQMNVFLRTDGYYVLSNALGCRNLAGDAKAYLRARLRRRDGSGGAAADAAGDHPSRLVRAYAIGYALTVAALSLLGVLGLAAVLWSGGVGMRRESVAVAVTILFLLGAALAARRRRGPARYRLSCPPGL